MTYFPGDDPFADSALGHALTRAIVDTIHEPFLVLDTDLRIIVASRSFYEKFKTSKEDTQGKLFYEINEKQYNIPALRHFLKNIVPEHAVMKEYKIVHDFPSIGPHTLLLSAREVVYENSGRKHILLTIGDITGQENLEIEKDKLSKQKDLMMAEMKHRMANSLQLIASILILKSEVVDSHGGMTTSAEGISLGLITAELVINAVKHVFPDGKGGRIVVAYEVVDNGWKLSVRDNGVGISINPSHKGGLGTVIVQSLAHQLKAKVETHSGSQGTTVSIVNPK